VSLVPRCERCHLVVCRCARPPTLHITNWPSRKLHGPGRKLSIMATPRRWEHGDGRVHILVPLLADMRAAKAGQISVEEYCSRFHAGVARYIGTGELAPGRLLFAPKDTAPGTWEPVQDGDTLLCACKRADAAKGRCHRVWAADILAGHGWNVVLDGERK